ncbi:hypothetical protein HYALB_00001359 [Hymenoscyphus albidus]|uniref:Kelch repeat protein n=1 Tax=Hymenoscyphus albidus TaxID=595503 RepID=A0A9N9LIF6_9HELO|nr:hypothetical protein HYALB_00001359 [Hymenoscyphus albidus]
MQARNPTMCYDSINDWVYWYGAISGLVKYDFRNQTWSNSSTVGMAGYEEGFSVVGQGVFVPIFGQDGIIIFLGGDSPTSQDWKMASSLQPMSQITIFDVSSGQSYSQPATGTSIPVSRVSFCAVGVGASDNSTWEIFMYGGKRTSSINHPLDPKTLPDLSAIYILTLPAFEWFKAPVDVTNRLDHQREVMGSRQMLSIGGIIENNVTHKDPWADGLGILDMTEVAWKTEDDPHAAPYTPSSIIKEHYQDSTKHYPKSWGNPALEFIFRASRNISNVAQNNTASPKASPKDTLADPTKVPSAANEPPEQKSTHSTPNTNTVVGVTIGSAIALVFCLIIVLWKKSAHARSFITKRLAFLRLSTPTPKHNSSVSNLTEPQLVEKDGFPIWEVDGKDRHLEMDAGFRAEMSGQHGVSELQNTSPMERRFSGYVMANGSLVELPI